MPIEPAGGTGGDPPAVAAADSGSEASRAEDPGQVVTAPVVRVGAALAEGAAGHQPDTDQLAVEEPLEIRLGHGPLRDRRQRSVAITMRTPGNDEELALGFLFTEGIVAGAEQVRSVGPCGEAPPGNVIRAELDPEARIDFDRLQRHFYTSSSCGVCGKQSLEAVRTEGRFRPSDSAFTIAAALLHRLPERLLEFQASFRRTGGLHAAALFDDAGRIHALREDVGRHNAVDKLIGMSLREGRVPLRNFGILVSGRASFELIQKAMMAGCPLFAAIGAPSSLAVQAAREFGIAMAGFVRDGRFNIYTGGERFVARSQL